MAGIWANISAPPCPAQNPPPAGAPNPELISPAELKQWTDEIRTFDPTAAAEIDAVAAAGTYSFHLHNRIGNGFHDGPTRTIGVNRDRPGMLGYSATLYHDWLHARAWIAGGGLPGAPGPEADCEHAQIFRLQVIYFCHLKGLAEQNPPQAGMGWDAAEWDTVVAANAKWEAYAFNCYHCLMTNGNSQDDPGPYYEPPIMPCSLGPRPSN